MANEKVPRATAKAHRAVYGLKSHYIAVKTQSVLSGLFSVPLLDFHHQTISLLNKDGSSVFLFNDLHYKQADTAGCLTTCLTTKCCSCMLSAKNPYLFELCLYILTAY